MVRPSGFEGYLRALRRPAEAMTLPPPVGPPSPEQRIAAMEAALLAEHGGTSVRGEGPGTPRRFCRARQTTSFSVSRDTL